MKKLAVTAAFAAAALVCVPSQGADNQTFSVNLSLTPVCQLGTVGAIDLSYTAFHPDTVTDTATAIVQCNSAFTYELSFDSGAAASGVQSSTYTDSTTNLQYTLSVPATYDSEVGTNAEVSVTITATIVGNQAGTCGTAGGCTSSPVRTLYLTN